MHAHRLCLLLLAALLLGIGGCRDATSTTPASTVRIDTYIVRGVVVSVPSDTNDEFQIRHEEIPEFRGPAGKLGMMQMTMPFPVGEGVTYNGIARDTIVKVTFDVEFDTERDRPTSYYITAIEALPADTVLDFNPRTETDTTSDDNASDDQD